MHLPQCHVAASRQTFDVRNAQQKFHCVCLYDWSFPQVLPPVLQPSQINPIIYIR